MADLLVDTDVFIDHLRGARALRPGRHRVHYSVITRCELLSGAVGSGIVQTLLDPFRELAVGRGVAERAGRIRREAGIATPDALIAATAIEHGLALVTRNRKHFEPVKQLRLRALGLERRADRLPEPAAAADAPTPAPAAGRRSTRPGTRRRRSP